MKRDADKTVTGGLTAEASKLLDSLTDGLGMKKKEALSKLVTWFTQQERSIQMICLGMAGNDEPALLLAIAAKHPAALGRMLDMALEIRDSVDQSQRKRREEPPNRGRAAGR